MACNLSIIIINWNSVAYLDRCLSSIENTITNLPYEVIVVDNASFDGSDNMIRNKHPSVQYIQQFANMGFSVANNQAFKHSNGEYLLFLNPDTEAIGSAVSNLVNTLRSLPAAGIVGGKLLNTDLTLQTTCIRAFPTITNQLLESTILRRIFPRSKLWGSTALYNNSGDSPSKVDAISGACLMIKRSLFEGVHYFSDDYFMYSEDIDLCLKALQSGWASYYVPSAVFIHHGGKSTAKKEVDTFSTILQLESRWKYFNTFQSSKYANAYKRLMGINSLVRVIILSLLWSLMFWHRSSNRIRSALRKWLVMLSWSLGYNGSVKTQ